MIDTGANANFMSERFVLAHQLRVKSKTDKYELQTADGSLIKDKTGVIDQETRSLPVAISTHHEEIVFDVFSLATYDVILGMPWMKKHNPTIDWEKGELQFEKCACVIRTKPTRRQSSEVDEKQSHNLARTYQILVSNKVDSTERTSSTDTEMILSGQEVRVDKGSHNPLEIPKEYANWEWLFQEEVTAAALPKHQPWDHEIILEEGKEPTFESLYRQTDRELEVTRDYLDKNLKKGFIRELLSSAGYPILFVPKKGTTELRMMVDYRKLNTITKKNRYPLPNIEELRDRTSGASYFTKLDMRGAFNLIRMKEGHEWYTAFRTRYRLYEYLVMPMGLTNAPATC